MNKYVGQPRKRLSLCIEDLGWNRLWLHSSELMKEVADYVV